MSRVTSSLPSLTHLHNAQLISRRRDVTTRLSGWPQQYDTDHVLLTKGHSSTREYTGISFARHFFLKLIFLAKRSIYRKHLSYYNCLSRQCLIEIKLIPRCMLSQDADASWNWLISWWPLTSHGWCNQIVTTSPQQIYSRFVGYVLMSL